MMELATDVHPEESDIAVAEAAPEERGSSDDGVTADLLIEDVSIDGMCGVY